MSSFSDPVLKRGAGQAATVANILAYAVDDISEATAAGSAEAPYCYNINKTWVENLASGLPQLCRDMPKAERHWGPEDKWITFLDHKLASPLGVAAGPLLSSEWVGLAASRGYDVLTYKTIRSHYHPGHGLPNILYLDVNEQLQASDDASQQPLYARAASGCSAFPSLACASAAPLLAITNSFGMPSASPEQLAGCVPAGAGAGAAAGEAAAAAGVAAATGAEAAGAGGEAAGEGGRGGGGSGSGGGDLAAARAALVRDPGQMLVVSVTGTPGRPGLSFADDLAAAARVALAGGASVIEVNLSCPNVGASHVALYQDAPAVEGLVTGLKQVVGAVPMLLKVGAFPGCAAAGGAGGSGAGAGAGAGTDELRRVLAGAAAAGAAGVAGINGLSRRVEAAGGGGPALGPARPSSGVCGDPIREAGLEWVGQARTVIDSGGLGLALVGVGGVTQAEHAMEYLRTGADVVQAATGFMWKPHLGTDFQRLWAEAGYSAPRVDVRGGRG